MGLTSGGQGLYVGMVTGSRRTTTGVLPVIAVYDRFVHRARVRTG